MPSQLFILNMAHQIILTLQDPVRTLCAYTLNQECYRYIVNGQTRKHVY